MREDFRAKLFLADKLNIWLFMIVPWLCIRESILVAGLYVAGLSGESSHWTFTASFQPFIRLNQPNVCTLKPPESNLKNRSDCPDVDNLAAFSQSAFVIRVQI
jgi:hypothetical protein